MKNKFLFLFAMIAGSIAFFASCYKAPANDSTPQATSIPYIAIQYLQDAYVYGQGQSTLYSDVPDVVAVAVDSVVGFEGGYGGKTGSDSIKIFKSEVLGWPDTTQVGGYSIHFEKFNRSNFKAALGANIVIAGPISDPGPTALEGDYLRAATGVVIQLKKVFDGVYVIDNPGGAGVPPFPYLFYNHKSSSGTDSLVFPIQTNPCGGGLQLVGPSAPGSLTSAAYSAQYPPVIASYAPVTLQWRVYEFPSARPTSANTGAALCQWGLGIRTFEKQ